LRVLDLDKLNDKAAVECAPATRYGSCSAVYFEPFIIHMSYRLNVAKDMKAPQRSRGTLHRLRAVAQDEMGHSRNLTSCQSICARN
jgi:hypothetical protein